MSSRAADGREKKTIFDVAAAAGVSIKTVSRVVNDEPNVRGATRQKVLDAIARLNYSPNAAARGLSGKRSYVIGLIYENPEEFNYIGAVLKGAQAACEDLGYSLLLKPISLPDEEVGEQVRQFVRQASIDGLLLPPPLADQPEVVRVIKAADIPYAALTPRTEDADAIRIFCEDETASYELTDYLISQGHTRIGFIKGHPDHDASGKRLAGYRAALAAHGIRRDPKLVRQGYFDFESGRRCAAKLLALSSPPSVIVASNDDMAGGVMFEAHERGLAVPEDVSVAGFDDTPLASRVWPTLTTVRQPIAAMAETATRLLVARLRGDDEQAEETLLFRCDLVIRSSTASA